MLRNTPESLVLKDMPDRFRRVLGRMPDVLISNMFTTVSFNMMSKQTSAITSQVVRLLRVTDDEKGLNVGMIPASKNSLRLSVQKNVWVTFMEKVCKRGSQQDFITSMNLCEQYDAK